MKSIRNGSCLLFLFLAGVFAGYAQNQVPANGVGPLVQKDEIVTDLSLVISNIKEVIIPQGKKIHELVPQGLEINEKAQVKVTDPTLLTDDDYVIDLKVSTTDGVFYNTTIRLLRKNDRLVTAVITDKIEMAEGWRKDGKIYVVIAVSLTLFIVIIGFLVSLSRSTAKLKKQVTESTKLS